MSVSSIERPTNYHPRVLTCDRGSRSTSLRHAFLKPGRFRLSSTVAILTSTVLSRFDGGAKRQTSSDPRYSVRRSHSDVASAFLMPPKPRCTESSASTRQHEGWDSVSDADSATRTTKRGKTVRNRLHVRVYVGYNHRTLKRFMPPICPPGQDSGGLMGGRIRSSTS
jgi:hypothetical protein